MRPLTLIIFILWSLSGICQSVQTNQNIISNNGATLNNNSGTKITYSIGEPVIFKGSSNSMVLTQGFHQPNKGLNFTFELTPISCMGANDGSLIISEINGCNAPYTLIVNGETQNSLSKQGLSAGNYTIEISSTNCLSSQEVYLSEPDTACELHFFNGFTPNNDGSNDSWQIQNIQVSPFEVNSIEIFNRWGEIIWKGENYDNTTVVFSGKDDNGNDLPDGTYYYFAKVNSMEYSGFITLIR